MKPGEIFITKSEAARRFKTHKQKILHCLEGKSHHTRGYTFSYLNKNGEVIPNQYEHMRRKKIKCNETNEIFESIALASKKFNVHLSTIQRKLQQKYKDALKYQKFPYTFSYVVQENK